MVNRRRRISIYNSTNGKEWSTHISPIRGWMAVVAIVVSLFFLMLILVGYTSILEILPAYRTSADKSRDRLIENIIKIDSMERVINDIVIYNENVGLIMEGKTPVVRSSQLNDTLALSKVMIAPSPMDSLLRREMEGDGEYNLLRATINKSSILLISPMEGDIIQQFDIQRGVHSIKIEARGSETKIEAAADGTVIFSQWSPEQGYVIGIQHAKGFISIYKNLSQSLLSSSEMVKCGEVIGYSLSQREFEFELWENGKAVNPENYIIF